MKSYKVVYGGGFLVGGMPRQYAKATPRDFGEISSVAINCLHSEV